MRFDELVLTALRIISGSLITALLSLAISKCYRWWCKARRAVRGRWHSGPNARWHRSGTAVQAQAPRLSREERLVMLVAQMSGVAKRNPPARRSTEQGQDARLDLRF